MDINSDSSDLLLPFNFCIDAVYRRKPVQKIALAIVHDRAKNKVLLLKRHDTSDYTGWVFPGGKIDERHNERVHICARRELKEETGLAARFWGRKLHRRIHPETKVDISYIYFQLEDIKQETRCGLNLEPSKAVKVEWVDLENVSKKCNGKISKLVFDAINEFSNQNIKHSTVKQLQLIF